jgi:hypothetical protein
LRPKASRTYYQVDLTGTPNSSERLWPADIQDTADRPGYFHLFGVFAINQPPMYGYSGPTITIREYSMSTFNDNVAFNDSYNSWTAN